MRKTLLYILSIILLQSCSWFDVGAESEIDEKDMFVNADGYYTALTGIYISMGSSKKSFVNGRCVKLLETYVKHFHIYL